MSFFVFSSLLCELNDSFQRFCGATFILHSIFRGISDFYSGFPNSNFGNFRTSYFSPVVYKKKYAFFLAAVRFFADCSARYTFKLADAWTVARPGVITERLFVVNHAEPAKHAAASAQPITLPFAHLPKFYL